MLLFLEKGIRGGICHSVYRNAKANNKYMKYYDKHKNDSFLIYTDYNNLYGKAMCRRLPISDFRWEYDTSKIDEDFITKYDDDDSFTGYFIEADIEYPKELHNLHSGLPFSPEIMKINGRKKLTCS